MFAFKAAEPPESSTSSPKDGLEQEGPSPSLKIWIWSSLVQSVPVTTAL